MYEVSEADIQRILEHHLGRPTAITEFSQLKQDGFECVPRSCSLRASI